MSQEGKKILKSIDNHRCLTKCHPKGTKYLHPVLLTGISHTLDSCAIEPTHVKKNLYNMKEQQIIVDECNLQDNSIYLLPNQLESILSTFYFNHRDFLSDIYNLHNFEQVIEWTNDNNFLPFDTIKRVHNCAWIVYITNYEDITDIVYNYYYHICTTNWIKDYSDFIKKKYSFNFITDKEFNDENISDFYKLINDNFLTLRFFIISLKKYVKKNQSDWEEINDHYLNIKNFVFEELINAIEIKSETKEIK